MSRVRGQSAAQSTFLSVRVANRGRPLSRGWSQDGGSRLITRDVTFQPFDSEAARCPYCLGLHFKPESLIQSSSSPTTSC